MDTQQLYLAIGIPVIVNILFNGTVAMLMSSHFNAQLAALRSEFRALLEGQSALFTEKLKRVEDVIDARLKHLEEK